MRSDRLGQRVKRIIMNNGDVMENIYDGMPRLQTIGMWLHPSFCVEDEGSLLYG